MSQSSEITSATLLDLLVEDNDNVLDHEDTLTVDTVKTPVDFVEAKGNNKVGRFIFTAFPPDTNPKYLEPQTYFETNRIAVWCGQFEECPDTETLHLHIYCEFINSKKLRFNSIRQAIEKATGKTGNVQLAKKCSRSQRQGAVNYVLKDSGRMFGTERYIWQGAKVAVNFDPSFNKEKKKQVTEKDKQVEYIESKPKHWTWDMIVHESKESKLLLASCSWGAKFHAGRAAENPRRTIQNVVVFYGAGGTGKTTIAQKWDSKPDEDFHERYYKRNPDDGKFWGGGRTAYRGQRIIHLEEFCGQETAANFKEICDVDKHGPSVNIKNGGTELNHDTVIITSNHHPAGWYKRLCHDDNKQWNPICRRITKVWFFPEFRPDGSPNIPDQDNPSYSIDQTDDFLGFAKDYNLAIRHAEEHWPLPDLTKVPYNPPDEPPTKRTKFY